jgi:tetratricopeptide (TPR) repeat protein
LTAAFLPGYAASMNAVRSCRHIIAILAGAAVLAGVSLAPGLAQSPKVDPAPPENVPPEAAPPQAKPAPKAKAPHRSSLPKTPAEREKTLSDLYALLATADSEDTAKAISDAIERVWLHSGSDTVDLLVERSVKALNDKNTDLALRLLNAVVELAPDFTEGWNRRAYVHFVRKETELALGDLRRALALDPNHYKALDGLGQILRELGQKKPALKAFRQLLEVHPYWSGAQQVVDELEREVDGQGI